MAINLTADISPTTRQFLVTGTVEDFIEPGYHFRLGDEALTLTAFGNVESQGPVSRQVRRNRNDWIVERGVESEPASHTAGATIKGARDAFVNGDDEDEPDPFASGGGGSGILVRYEVTLNADLFLYAPTLLLLGIPLAVGDVIWDISAVNSDDSDIQAITFGRIVDGAISATDQVWGSAIGVGAPNDGGPYGGSLDGFTDILSAESYDGAGRLPTVVQTAHELGASSGGVATTGSVTVSVYVLPVSASVAVPTPDVPVPTSLAWAVQPADGTPGDPLAQFLVAVLDQYGGVYQLDNATVVTLVASAGTLSGTNPATVAGGYADFSDIEIAEPETGVTLTASAPGFDPIVSDQFDVTAP